MTPETAFHRHFSHDEKSSSKRDTVTGTGGSNTIKTSLSRSRPQDQPRQQAQSTLASGSDPAHNDFARDTETEMTKRLELLERRFLEPPHHITRNSCDSGGSHHSFTFDRSGSAAFRTGSRSRLSGSQTPSTRNGKSRARRGRSCTSSPSTQILENVADQHMKKVSRTLGEAPHSQPRPPPQDANSSSGMHNIHSASASAPYNPLLSPASASANSNNRSHSMSSNQTLITAHVTKRSGHGHSSGSTSAPATEVIVAESPPITYTNQERNLNLSLNKPGSFARNGATPRVARTILGETDSDSPATPSNRGKTITPTHSRAGNKRKTSVPTRLVEKKRQRNLKFHDRDHSKSETETATPSEPLTSASASANAETNAGTTMPITPIVSSLPAPNDPIENVASFSKGSLSPANNGTLKNHHHHGAGAGMGASPNVSTTSAIGNQKPSANMLITKFFGTSQSSKKKASRPISIPSKLQHTAHKNNSGDNGNASDKVIDTTQPAGKYPKNDHLIQEIAMLKSSISSLTESLNEKSAQLKAVSNNQTIIHSQLKKSLQDRDQEIKALKEETEERNSKMRHALEKLIRKESAREHAEMRQKLASDGARLGRWIYNWVGMRRETVWEDGTAMKACDKRRNELKRKRDVLENRLKEGSKTLGDLDAMEREEFQQSIRVHLDELERAEKELKKEDDALYAEKNAHKLALKQVTNEDYSKFKSMPKVSPILDGNDAQTIRCNDLHFKLCISLLSNSSTTVTCSCRNWERGVSQRFGVDLIWLKCERWQSKSTSWTLDGQRPKSKITPNMLPENMKFIEM